MASQARKNANYLRKAIVFSVTTFGAVGDGVSDDTAAIQAAIDHAESFGAAYGASVEFPGGEYLYSSLNISAGGVDLRGLGKVTLKKTTTSGDGLAIVGSGSRIYGIELTNLTFIQNAASAASGRALYLENLGGVSMRDITVTSVGAVKPFTGFELNNVSQCEIIELKVAGCASNGFYAHDCVDLYLTNSRSDANGGAGFLSDTVSGFYATNVTAWNNAGNNWDIRNTVGVPIIASAGAAFHFMTNCVGDTGGGHNWSVVGLHDSSFTNCWGSTQSGAAVDKHGMHLDSCSDIDLHGFHALTNNGCGVNIQSSTRITAIGGNFKANGKQAGSINRAGVHVSAGSDLTWGNGRAWDNQSSKTQQYGLRIAAGANVVQITGCRMDGNLTAPYSIDAIPSVFIEDNNYTGESTDVPSANIVALPKFGKRFTITGTTTINGITDQWNGRQVTLVFNNTCTLVDTGSLKLNSNFAATADDAITLLSDGANFYETGRSAN